MSNKFAAPVLDDSASTLEALATTINTNVADIETLATTINTNIADVETLATTISGNVADIETLLSACSSYRKVDLDVTGQVAKASAGTLYAWAITNANALTSAFVKIYNKATAPTQADTPVLTLQVAALGFLYGSIPNGASFAAGISARATTGVADNDTGDPTANDVIAHFFYR